MTNANIDIVIPPGWTGVYINTAKLLKYSIDDLNLNASIIETGETQEGELSIILGWHLVPDEVTFERSYIIYQLEPLILPLWQEKMKQKIKLFQSASAIWDYSEANREFLNQLGFQPKIVPLGYHPKLKEVTPSEFPDYDVLFVGFMTERRKMVINELQQHCCVSIQPRWGKDFLDALGRSKILLNIHQYDFPTPLEQPRIVYALNNDTFIISESSADKPIEGLVTCDYEKIKDTVLHSLYNPIKRKEKKITSLRDFKKNKMKDLLLSLLSLEKIK